MSSELFRRATDPNQYNAIDWSGEASPNSAHRLWVWEFLSQFQDLWEGKDVLEIGSGTGWFVERMRDQEIKSIIGFEPSKKNFRIAKERNPDIELINTSLDSFTTDKQFDVIVMVYVISHLDDLEIDLKKIYDMLKPGGFFLNVIPDYDYCRTPRGKLDIQIEELNENECVILSKREQGEMADVIRKTNFTIKKHEEAGFTLVNHVEMKPTEILKKDAERFKKHKNKTLGHLLVFNR